MKLAIFRTKPSRWNGCTPLTNDERRALWAAQYFTGGHHRRQQKPRIRITPAHAPRAPPTSPLPTTEANPSAAADCAPIPQRAGAIWQGIEMSDAIEFVGTIRLTPEQVAEAFWNMGADEQATFYAHLKRIADPVALVMQAQAIINHIAESDDADARDGFTTLHDYAAGYVENAIDWRSYNAKSAIRQMTHRAIESHA